MSKYIVSGKAKVVFAPAVANIAAPTTGEMSAGTILNNPGGTVIAGLISMTGFTSEQGFITTADLQTDTDSKFPGRRTIGDASMMFYDDDASSTIRTALAEGTAGYICRFPYGQSAGKRCEVFPVTIGALNDADYDATANEVQKFSVAVAITAKPNKNSVSPA